MSMHGDARFLSAFGASLPVLPWRSSAAALRALDADARRSVDDFERALGRAWLSDDPVQAFGAAIHEVTPRDTVVLYPGALGGPPRWTLSTMFDGFRGELPVRNEMPKMRLYGERANDSFANRPVNLHDLARLHGARYIRGVIDALLLPIGAFHQLRTVLYAGPRVALFAGLYRPERARPFDLEDHARLFALQPLLRRWHRIAEAIGVRPLGDAALVAAIDAIGLPALLVDRKTDAVVYANRDARSEEAVGLTTFAALRRDPRTTTVPLRTARSEIDLVVLPPPPPDSTRSVDRVLPPYLRPIALLLREGLSDKEIAARADLRLATARTYVQRILHLLETSDRRTLIRPR